MPNWNETEFVERARGLAVKHVASKTGLNDLAEKVARDESLNPNEIRTLVRLANVATFNTMFGDKKDQGHGDRMVEFEPGDPEAVIQRIVAGAAGSMEPPETANINNDKLASESLREIPDMMREVRQGFAFEAEKVAAYTDHEEKPAKKDIAVLALRKLAEDFDIERTIQGNKWENKIATLSRRFRRAESRFGALGDFEKDAFAAFGDVVLPEVTGVRAELKLGPIMGMDTEKVAYLQEHHAVSDSIEMALLKEAMVAREGYEKLSKGFEHVTSLLHVSDPEFARA